MKRIVYKLSRMLRIDSAFANLLRDVKYRWQDFGPANQILLVLGSSTVLGLSMTAYNIAATHYEVREIKCLALNIYHEARGEPESGQFAVATVTMNRVQSDRYPDDVCRVVYQRAWNRKLQRYISAFSWTDYDTVSQIIPKENSAWRDAYAIAEKVYRENQRSEKTKDALFYHANYVTPAWASEKTKVAKIGRHIFYR